MKSERHYISFAQTPSDRQRSRLAVAAYDRAVARQKFKEVVAKSLCIILVVGIMVWLFVA